MDIERPGRRLLRLALLAVVLCVAATGGALAHGGEDDGGATGPGETDRGWLGTVGALVVALGVPVGLLVRLSNARTDGSLGGRHALAVGLALFSAAVHVFLFLRYGDALMLLAGLGFVGGALLFALDLVPGKWLYPVGIGYASVQVLLWLATGASHLATFGLLDKLAQVALVALLWRFYREEEAGPAVGGDSGVDPAD